MRIVTWNVAGLNARLHRVKLWIEENQPDVLCLQETKMEDEVFEKKAQPVFKELGYESVHNGQKSWNGVSIISRVGIENPQKGFDDGRKDPDPDARIVWATCSNIRIASCYVPNGRTLGDDHYKYKLDWLNRLHDDLKKNSDPSKNHVITAGDFNVCPRPIIDEWDPKEEYTNFDWKSKKTLTETFDLPETHITSEVRGAIKKLDALGMKDVFCERFPEEKADTFWEYPKNAFRDKRGLRIDLVLASGVVAESLNSIEVDMRERTPEKILEKENKGLLEKYKDAKGKFVKPSDHAPLAASFDWSG